VTNWLTDGRTALLTALQNDATLSAAVRKWFDWGPGLRQRFDVLPAYCPIVSVVAAELDEDQIANAATSWPQDVEIGIATDGQDLEPCEELVAAALDVVQAENMTCLGLVSAGVSGLNVVSIRWHAEVDEKDARVRWFCALVVRIHWMRRT